MGIPSKNNAQGFDKKINPVSHFVSAKGKTSDIEIYSRETGVELVSELKASVVAVSYYKYHLNEATRVSHKSTEYFTKKDNVSVFKRENSSRKGERVYSGIVGKKTDRIKTGIYGAINLDFSTGCNIYCIDSEGNYTKIELTAGQRGRWFDFKKEVENDCPDMRIEMTETTREERTASKNRMPEFLMRFSLVNDVVISDPVTISYFEHQLNEFFGSPEKDEITEGQQKPATEGDDLPF